jgi:hypothetical protein
MRGTPPPSPPQDVVEKPFATVTYTEAIQLLKSSGHKFDYPVEWGLDMQSEHERFLSETVGRRAQPVVRCRPRFPPPPSPCPPPAPTPAPTRAPNPPSRSSTARPSS